MEALLLILIGAIVALYASLDALKRRVAVLERRLSEPSEVPVEPLAAPPPPVAAAAARPDWLGPAPPERYVGSEDEEEGEEEEERETLGRVFERFVAGRLLVWIGGVALFVAAIFLIRHSIEIGLVTPAARMIAAGLFGLALLGAGEYARSGRLFSDDPRFAQALVGTGLAVLYATAYGSHILYALIGLGTASAAMVAVTAAALVLALRHGAPTAVLGLLGGFLTPLLVGDSNAGTVRLLAYLALLDAGIFALAWRRGWTWLAAGAVALSFLWAGALLVRPPQDALAAGLFVVLLAVAASLLRPGPGRELRLMQPLAIGLVQLAALVARTDLGAAAWALFGALASASLLLALLRPGQRIAPPLALALALALLLAKATTGADPLVPWAAAGATLLFGVGGIAAALRRDERLWTALAAAGIAGPFVIVRAARPELLETLEWGLLAAALTAGPALLVHAGRGRAGPKPPGDLALLAAGAAAALLGGAAVWDLAGPELTAAGWIAVAVAVALAARRLDDFALATVASLTATVAVARALWTVPELSTAALTALIGEPVLAADLPDARTALFALALPAALLGLLGAMLPPLPLGARRALPAVAGLFAATALYVWFKQAWGLASFEDFVARGMAERTVITQALFLAGWLLAAGIVRPPRVEPDLARAAGAGLTAFAAARLVWFDMLLHNPLWAAQQVGALPLLNLVLPAYLLSAVWLYAARRRAGRAGRSGAWLALFLAALLLGVMLIVRQGFQGPLLDGPDLPSAEFYLYSLAALLVAIALIVAGIRLPDKALRLSGLLLLTAATIKAFGFDADELDGIWRILSLFGLGVALIGIARLYGPVLRAEARGNPAHRRALARGAPEQGGSR